MPRIVTNLWMDTQAEEAADFYCSVFPRSRVVVVTRYPEGTPRAGDALTVEIELDGQPVTILNGGPEFTFDEAISLLVECDDQAEIDHYWEALGAGGEPGPCGWLKDRYGLSWQICPKGMETYLNGDPGRSKRAFDAVMQMGKLDLAAIQAAADGEAAITG